MNERTTTHTGKAETMKITHELAMAAGRDAANAQMEKAGRTKWSRTDYNAAVALYDSLCPVSRTPHCPRTTRHNCPTRRA